MPAALPCVLRAVDYIEDHLDRTIALDDVAAAVGLSRFTLHRAFMATIGETLKGYIRKRRLTEAAQRLAHTDDRIIELALDAGFTSQEAFTRAFRACFDVTPGRWRRDRDARRLPGLLRATPESARHRQRGVTRAPRLIERTEPLRVRGLGTGTDFEDDSAIRAVWEQVLDEIDRSAGCAKPTRIIGVSMEAHPAIALGPSDWLAYLGGVDAGRWPAHAPAPVEVDVPPGLYAVFEHRGPLEHIVDTVNYAWATWLPRSGYTKANRPDLELAELSALYTPCPAIALWVAVEPGPPGG